MIRVYGGTVTEGLTDGIEVGTAENPILFDGLYPAFNGSTGKALTFAVRTDGENIYDVCMIAAMLVNGTDIELKSDTSTLVLKDIGDTYGKSLMINPNTYLFRKISSVNQIFTLTVNAKGSEDVTMSPDLRAKLYFIPLDEVLTKNS